ncbi:adenylate/guanylate cyclase domain-containing protein [Argonema antarcticum A004/B2]|nr:adenylate cyclase [Argonema antarcticum]MCL1471102.1 adenylate/guanylate cyclase domain-containing protein [Argonema antarcticum A004/B2]
MSLNSVKIMRQRLFGNTFLASLKRKLKRQQEQTQAEIADYEVWRREFLQKRLRLGLRIAFIGFLSFIALQFRNFIVRPDYFDRLALITHIASELSLLVCLSSLRTRLGRRYPSLIFLIFSWSITLIPLLIVTIADKLEPNMLSWPLAFFGMATLVPVCWRLHLVSQLGVFAYYFGVQLLLGKVAQMPAPWMTSALLYLYMFWVCFVCDLSVYLYERLQRSEFKARRQMEAAYQQLTVEQEQSERLLLNVLPQSIAARLKNSTGTLAEQFNEATVLFADIVGFTQLSTQIPPTEMVELLNNIFSRFDELAEKHGLEKIKTIGDSYMVVSGLPIPRPDHVEAIADMALDMQLALNKVNIETNQDFRVRIGINTGPVVAGVIGLKKFIYDLWGDTVNIASRMESQGIPNCIQVTKEVYEILKNQYVFEERGIIHVKGRGDMLTYLLKSKSSDCE